MVLKSKSEMSKALNHEELSVWLSTTMIQALRNMISLFTHFFGSLEYMLDRFLDLLALCICQENDTLARIGSNCLQQLILQNVTKFTPEHWDSIVGAFVDLFARTEATSLFSAAVASSNRKESINGSKTSANSENLALGETQSADPASLPMEDSLTANGLATDGSPNNEEYTPPTRSRANTITATPDLQSPTEELESFAPSTLR